MVVDRNLIPIEAFYAPQVHINQSTRCDIEFESSPVVAIKIPGVEQRVFAVDDMDHGAPHRKLVWQVRWELDGERQILQGLFVLPSGVVDEMAVYCRLLCT